MPLNGSTAGAPEGVPEETEKMEFRVPSKLYRFVGMLTASATALVIATGISAQVRAPAAAGQAGIEIAGPVLIVTDLERSLKFYVDGLGLQASARLPGNPGPGAVVTAPGHSPMPFLLIRQAAALPSQSPQITHGNALSRIMLILPDSAAAATRLSAAGFTPGPVSARGIFFVKDPDGISYEIMQANSRH